ncbi:MAG: YicC family protein [Proteobacteria bacterium]|nr:YicC family protein [Pseudomonadota bacterium]
MAVYSMTGYASAALALENRPAVRVAAELRSVNGRFLDVSLRLPDELRHLEPLLREQLAGGLKRGKVELRLALVQGDASSLVSPPPAWLAQLAEVQAAIAATLPAAPPLSVAEVLQLARSAPTADAQPDDDARDALAQRAAAQAIAALREARAREGDKLSAMLRERLAALRTLATKAQPLLPAAVARQQARFLERWQEALASAGSGGVNADAAHERALAEAAAFAIRIDVAEELTRLEAHLAEIDHLLTKGGELGKRLDFLIQELHREANTLGSKSAALELTAVSVDMKVLIEQMREQVQNIE